MPAFIGWSVAGHPASGLFLGLGVVAAHAAVNLGTNGARSGSGLLADLTLPLFFGPFLAVGVGFALSPRIDTWALWFGGVAGLGVLVRRLVSGAQQVPTQPGAGTPTLAQVLGLRGTKRLLYCVFAVMWVLPPALVAAREGAWEAVIRGLGLALPLMFFAACLFVVHVVRRLQRAAAPGDEALAAVERVWPAWHWSWAVLVAVWI